MDRYAVFSSFFFRCYAGLWRVVTPFLRRNKRLADGWTERLAPADWLADAAPVDVWLQAASGGEAHLALTLLRALPDRPCLRVLIATWTRQGREVAERALPALLEEKPWLSVVVRFAPLDAPAVARRALELARPRLLVLLETELWPGLLGACAEAGVPVRVVNGRMTRASFEAYAVIRPVLQKLPLSCVHAVSSDDAARFARTFELAARPEEGATENPGSARSRCVDVMPNIKFDRAVAALDDVPSTELAPVFRLARPVFLLASVRKQEETRLAPWLGRLLQAFPRAVVVVAPRHMYRVDAWMSRLYDLGLRPRAASSLKPGEACPPGSTLVWDRFGDLPRLYALADVAYVGGGFGQGGQNFLEALTAGLVPCVGPSLDNFHWALGEEQPPSLPEAGLLTVCPNPRALYEALLTAAERPRDREEVRRQFKAWIAPRAGGAAYAARLLMEALDAPAR